MIDNNLCLTKILCLILFRGKDLNKTTLLWLSNNYKCCEEFGIWRQTCDILMLCNQGRSVSTSLLQTAGMLVFYNIVGPSNAKPVFYHLEGRKPVLESQILKRSPVGVHACSPTKLEFFFSSLDLCPRSNNINLCERLHRGNVSCISELSRKIRILTVTNN